MRRGIILLLIVTIQMVASTKIKEEHVDVAKYIIDKFSSGPTKELFKVYHTIHEKAYSLYSEEGVRRYKIFKSNFEAIKLHNQKNLSWKKGINQFTDMTKEEFRTLVGARPVSELKNFIKIDDDDNTPDPPKLSKDENDEIPEPPKKFLGGNKYSLFDELTKDLKRNLGSFDLFDSLVDDYENNSKSKNVEDIEEDLNEDFVYSDIDHRRYTPKVLDQGQCGSCYAFATILSVEAQFNIQYYKKFKPKGSSRLYTPRLSPQLIVDCVTWGETRWGCKGGWMPLVLRKLATDRFGFVSEDSYPYNAQENSCEVDQSKALFQLKGPNGFKGCDSYNFTKPARKCTKKIWYTLLKSGPLSVVYDVDGMQDYDSGIIETEGKACTVTAHAVTAVAWKKDDEGREYIVIQNSWTDYWGEKGFMRAYYSDDNQSCLLTSMGFLPVLDLDTINRIN